MAKSKKILIIPHSADKSVRRRLVEIGKNISSQHEVYFFDWHEAGSSKLAYRITASLCDLLTSSRLYKKDGLNIAQCSLLHWPHLIMNSYNQRTLNEFIRKNKFEVVINGTHYFFPIQSSKEYRHIFDLNDLPTLETSSAQGRFIYQFTRQQVENAQIVTACSQGLLEYAKNNFGVNARYIPNGVYLEEFLSIDHSTIEKLRNKHSLVGKKVLGLIGKVGEWIDLDFCLNFFQELKKRQQNLALLIVGDGVNMEKIKGLSKNSDIVFTGAVAPSEISAYFSLLDIGLLPSKKNIFQDVAFHIKLLEYTAASKMVISSDLEEVKRLALPNVIIAPLSLDKWVKAFEEASSSVWNRQWDDLMKEYAWENVASDFLRLIDE